MYGEGAEPLTVDKSPASLRTLVGIKLLRSHALLAWLGLFGLVCLVAGFFFCAQKRIQATGEKP